MSNPLFIVNVEAAIHKDGKWLLIERSMQEEHAGGLFALVGGKVEIEGHSSDILERTLKREIFEEVGLKVKNLIYVNSSSFVSDTGENVVDIVFLCEHESREAYAKSPDEVASVSWWTTQQIINHQDIPMYLKENIKLAETLKVLIGVSNS